jgi:hypothetical protein
MLAPKRTAITITAKRFEMNVPRFSFRLPMIPRSMKRSLDLRTHCKPCGKARSTNKTKCIYLIAASGYIASIVNAHRKKFNEALQEAIQ